MAVPRSRLRCAVFLVLLAFWINLLEPGTVDASEISLEEIEACERDAMQFELLQRSKTHFPWTQLPGRRHIDVEEEEYWEQIISEAEASWTGPGARGELNLCREGRLLPQFYLLGANKCGSSTLAEDMRRAGVASAAEPYKELKFFEYNGGLASAEVRKLSESQRASWLSMLPTCSQTDSRRILADYSPQNIYLTKARPKGWNDNMMDLPSVLQDLYGKDADLLHLSVIIREPLARYQSEFYYSAKVRTNKTWEELPTGAFQKDVEEVLHMDAETQLQSELFAGSLYARHLQQYLLRFRPDQLLVVPFHEYIAGDRSVTFRELSARLGVSLRLVDQDSYVNPNEHPPLDTDISLELREAFNHLISPEKDALVRVLAEASLQGAGLAGFVGQKGSEIDVRAWLDAGW